MGKRSASAVAYYITDSETFAPPKKKAKIEVEVVLVFTIALSLQDCTLQERVVCGTGDLRRMRGFERRKTRCHEVSGDRRLVETHFVRTREPGQG